MDERKLFVITGITGNQGGSVARTFLNDPEMRSRYRLRGISRQSSSEQVQSWEAQGVEMVQADLHDPTSLLKAFVGASVIFSVTDFWKPYFDPKNHAKAQEQGKHIGQYCEELEYEQGRNIADAASRIPELERLVVSMLSDTTKWSNGRYKKIHHFNSKADMITYVKSTYPNLAAKMSELNMGVFMQAWKNVPSMTQMLIPQRTNDGTYILKMPCDPNTPVPFVDVINDTGPFVRALLAVEPGIQLYGETALISWSDWTALWGRVTGKQARFEQVSVESWEEILSISSPQGFGTELGEMLEFMGIYGYDGGDPACKKKEEIGIEIPGLTNIEEYMKSEDWSVVVGV